MTKRQQKQFAPWFVLGAVGNWTFLAPLHELGHWMVGKIEGVRPEIITFNATEMDYVSLTNYLAGPTWELLVWSVLLWASYRFNRHWGWRGLFWANMLSAWLLTPFTSDLVRAYNMGWVHPAWWLLYAAAPPLIAIAKIREHLGYGNFTMTQAARSSP